MFTISSDERWDRTDAIIAQAELDIHARKAAIKDRNTLELKRAIYERDYYRNTMIMLCDGNRELVSDAMSASRCLYTQSRGWKY